MSLAEIMGGFGGSQNPSGGKSGLTLAKVTNINDPDGLNRIKCQPVTEDADVKETDWCYVLSPYGGKEYGLFFFPNVDDLVLLAYLEGNVHRPVAVGSVWMGETAPPYKIDGGKNPVSTIKTPLGLEIKLDETDDKAKAKITVLTPEGTTLGIDDEAKTITAQDAKGENMISLNWDAGEVAVTAKEKLTLTCGDASIAMEKAGKLTLTGKTGVSIAGKDVGLKADSAFTAEGATAEIKAQGKLSLSASGLSEVKGNPLKLN
jgi:uncharacterized protein involved in type VI secretion and phage assembly